MEIIKINANTYRIEDDFVRMFLLEGTEKALLIDTGMTTANAKEIAESITKLPVELLNTHADTDHVGGNKGFDKFYMNPNEEENFRRHGNDYGEIVPVKEGDVIDLGDRPLKIIDLPGHTPGSIGILDVKNRVLIGGDSVQNGDIFMFGPMRNIQKYIASMKHLKEYENDFDEVYPSHGTFPVNKNLIDKLIHGATEIVEGKAIGNQKDMFGNKILHYRFDYAGFFCDDK